MSELHPQQIMLLNWIDIEMQEQENRYRLDTKVGLKELKVSGVVLHPISVTRKSFGYADYPEIEFRLPFNSDTQLFRENSAIECFVEGEESIKGLLIGIESKKGKFRLFAPDYPDWIEDKGVGIKLAPDHRTSDVMKKVLNDLENDEILFKLFKEIHGDRPFGLKSTIETNISFRNKNLNSSQKEAVQGMINNEGLTILHGPPGTGKTTTLVEGIFQQVQEGKKIVVTAPSNTAVDNIAKGLLEDDVEILRVGNTLKVDELIYPHTPEGRLRESKTSKELKRLKIQAEELRKMSYQYKRNFGKQDREQRNLLIKEVKRIRKQIRDLKDYYNEKLYDKADVILGTPIGLANFLPSNTKFDVLVMDEAGQAIEPFAWVVFPYASKWVLAGDPYQLPPTVLSADAANQGYNISILERSFKNCSANYFLDTQYRMRKSISSFSNIQFYDNQLNTPAELNDNSSHVLFYDTAGAGFDEASGDNGTSLLNEGELSIINKLIEQEGMDPKSIAFISPYSGQVFKAKELLSEDIRISTIDSFQGQEMEVIILSMVRSNPDGVIGFLKDYRRMNVAMTRAKEKLIIIGDSSTIGQDKFYADFLDFVEKLDAYRSVWELLG